LELLLYVAPATKWRGVAEGLELEYMHAKENKIDDISQLKLKKSINHKPNIKIKF
jgi:hypothetical protein